MKKYLAVGMNLIAIVAVLTITSASQSAAQKDSTSTAAPSLDFEFFKTRVEPIFLKRRPGHPRCYACHVENSGETGTFTAVTDNHFHLKPLLAGSTSWTDEQSRQNFDVVSQLVTPGDPLKSRLLLHPLSPDAGGDRFHQGGRQFASQDDPDWMTIAQWVRGQTATGSSARQPDKQ